MLDIGDDAPTVTAETQDGETVELDFATPTVLYFYPRDDTPGCTVEAKGFNAELDAYEAAGVDVYGVSTDDADSHADFCEKHGLKFDLLADPEGEIADAFGVDHSSGAAERVTFVLADGEVKAAYAGVSPEGHAEEVLEDIRHSGLLPEE
ncbi:thiol peroxidase, Bcp-type [Halarchaeum acidiphilum MH1-52-1]|uniref:thioredoxin-dependent peroxiredoxin n=1 Tax=Halarchaeum acidiphilum MH1-52-1 TaxID=1261545 RepID=U2YTE0_9EURY|nr:peroxiredoxin [Halarchaeum acidiphilum]GAD52280.1 thiol peroxidase, Bcp-type [Halarchaeum acidiphilum MH1-52-1]